MQVVVAVVQLSPVFEVAVYPVIEDPPSDAGALQEITDCLVALAVALTAVGVSGFPWVVAEALLEEEPVPIPFVAVTVNV